MLGFRPPNVRRRTGGVDRSERRSEAASARLPECKLRTTGTTQLDPPSGHRDCIGSSLTRLQVGRPPLPCSSNIQGWAGYSRVIDDRRAPQFGRQIPCAPQNRARVSQGDPESTAASLRRIEILKYCFYYSFYIARLKSTKLSNDIKIKPQK